MLNQDSGVRRDFPHQLFRKHIQAYSAGSTIILGVIRLAFGKTYTGGLAEGESW